MYNTTVNINVLWTWFYFSWVCTQEWSYLITWYMHNYWRNWQTVFQSGCTLYGLSIYFYYYKTLYEFTHLPFDPTVYNFVHIFFLLLP